MTTEDRADLSEILQDPVTMTAYEHAFSPQEVDDWLARQRQRYRQDGAGLWAVVRREDGAFVGQVGLTRQDTGVRIEWEIGYLLKRRYWHHGYATEAAAGCRDYAFRVLDQERVVAIIRDTNRASQRVARRLGMQPEYRIIKHYYGVDMPHDVYVLRRPADKGRERHG